MNVLLVSLFHPELVRGGEQQICYELFEGLKSVPGVKPTLLASIDPSYGAFYKSGARITGFDGQEGEFLYLSREYDYWWHKTSNVILLESYAEFLELVKPDVIHFHHFLLFGLDVLTLTRQIMPEARIVFTFHEFLSICAADGQMLRLTDGSLCNRASPVRCHQCFPERGPEEFFMREMWVKRHLSAADMFTTPSRFMIEHYVNWGIERDKIAHVTNGQRDYRIGSRLIDKDRPVRNRFGFFGQLIDNKGVWVLLRAVDLLRQEGFTDFVVELNGDNLKYASKARRAEIEDFLEKEAELPRSEQIVHFNGSYHVDQLSQRMARVDWCIVPSVWWEIFGLVISEAWMFGRPVIASNIGGMAERITDEVDGLLFQVADPRSLAETIRRACAEEGLWGKLVAGIKQPASRDAMVEKFMNVYRGGSITSSEARALGHAGVATPDSTSSANFSSQAP